MVAEERSSRGRGKNRRGAQPAAPGRAAAKGRRPPLTLDARRRALLREMGQKGAGEWQEEPWVAEMVAAAGVGDGGGLIWAGKIVEGSGHSRRSTEA